MKFKTFIGIDPSCKTFEAASLCSSVPDSPLLRALGKFDNTQEGFGLLEQRILSLKHSRDSALICIEHIGPYNEALAEYFHGKGWSVWLASPLVISKSAGELVRGKTDAIDAERICRYAARFPDKARIFVPQAEWLRELRNLTKLRKRLVSYRVQIQNHSHSNEAKAQPCMITRETNNALLEQLNTNIQQVELRLEKICQAEPRAAHVSAILESIPGIGPVIRSRIIIATGAMAMVGSFRQLSIMACSAPFPYESGTSIKKRPKTSKMGDRKLKGDLYMGALRTTHRGQIFHEYYEHRKALGKPHNSIINDIINKMLKLAFDLCKKCELFDKQRYLAGKKSLLLPLTTS